MSAGSGGFGSWNGSNKTMPQEHSPSGFNSGIYHGQPPADMFFDPTKPMGGSGWNDSRQLPPQMDSRTPLMDSLQNPGDSGRYQSGPMPQANSFVHPGPMQSGHYVQAGTHQGQGAYPPEQSPWQQLTDVPPGDGASMVNAPFANQFGPQGRQSAMYSQMIEEPTLLNTGVPYGSQMASQNGTYVNVRGASFHGSPVGSQNGTYVGSRGESLHLVPTSTVDACEQYLGGMEGHTRMLRLMHEAFSNAQTVGPVEPKKPNQGTFKNFGFLSEIYKVCGFSTERSSEELEKAGVDNEIKRLYTRRKAADELMDEVENHISQIEQVIFDRRRHKERILASIGVKAGIMAQCCN